MYWINDGPYEITKILFTYVTNEFIAELLASINYSTRFIGIVCDEQSKCDVLWIQLYQNLILFPKDKEDGLLKC